MSDDLTTAKKELRGVMRERLDALDETERLVSSHAFCGRVFTLLRMEKTWREEFNLARMALYLATQREPNLDRLIHDLQKCGMEVLAPHFTDGQRQFYTIAPEGENIEIARFKNASLRAPREYSGGIARSPDELDVILIPGLAFDSQGNRLGRGGGWYDRVLAEAPDVLKIGVCFECQVLEFVPHEEHDVQMNFVVTEKRILEL